MRIFKTSSLPFNNADAEFGYLLKKNFLKPAVAWTLGAKGLILDTAPQIDVEMASCWWAIALYIEIYINAQHMPDLFSLSEREILGKQSVRLVKVLLDNQESNGSWDRGPWDTSVICRSMLLLVEASNLYREIQIESEVKEKIIQSVKMGLTWLIEPAVHWSAVRYSLGAEDLAMIVRLLCVVEKSGLDIFPHTNSKHNKEDLPGNTKELIQQIVDRLLRLKTLVEKGDGNIPVVYWETPFSTGHVVQAFCESLDLLSPEIRKRVVTRLAGAIIHIEETQDEGKWGFPNSTSLLLNSYVMACQTLDRHDLTNRFSTEPLPSIVFKAIRWLTDEKQRFSDGSILHTFTHTSFFILMVQNLILSNYYLLSYPILQIYDYVVWDSQIRVLEERGIRLKLTDELIKRNQEVSSYIRFYNATLTFGRIAAIFFGFILLLRLFLMWNLASIEFVPFTVNVLEPDAFFTGLGLFTSASSVFWFFSRKWLRTNGLDLR